MLTWHSALPLSPLLHFSFNSFTIFHYLSRPLELTELATAKCHDATRTMTQVRQTVRQSVRLSVRPSVSLSARPFFSQSVALSVRPSLTVFHFWTAVWQCKTIPSPHTHTLHCTESPANWPSKSGTAYEMQLQTMSSPRAKMLEHSALPRYRQKVKQSAKHQLSSN